jgi:hypothetical protein
LKIVDSCIQLGQISCVSSHCCHVVHIAEARDLGPVNVVASEAALETTEQGLDLEEKK